MSFQRSLVVILGAWKSLFGAVKLSFPSSRAVAVPGRGWSDCRVNGVRPGRAVVQNRRVTTLFLIVGFPGGKTTRAREFAADHRALRPTPDEWMIPLFGESNPDGKRDVL